MVKITERRTWKLDGLDIGILSVLKDSPKSSEIDVFGRLFYRGYEDISELLVRTRLRKLEREGFVKREKVGRNVECSLIEVIEDGIDKKDTYETKI